MAALTQTAANVAIGSSSTPTKTVQYGESVTQGQPLYKSSVDGKYYKTDCNDTAAKAACAAIALTPGGADAYGLVALPGSRAEESLINLGATLAVGTTYSIGQTVGSIVPNADLTTNDFVTNIGIAATADFLDFQVTISNKQKA